MCRTARSGTSCPIRLLAVLALPLALASSGCTSATSGQPGATPAPGRASTGGSPPAASDRLLGLVALGHSGITGYASDPQQPGADARENSWATGTNPAVDSIALRLTRAEPSVAGAVENDARDGTAAGQLVDEASIALSNVPHPQLIIIQTIETDVQCDGTDGAHRAVFGDAVARALHLITAASPQTKILLLSKLGRPATEAAALQGDREARAHLSGDRPCDLFTARGQLAGTRITTLTRIIEGYEQELALVCAKVPRCHGDGGAMTRYVTGVPDLVPGDWRHLNVHGHARLAALMWPTVARILGSAD